MGIDWKEFAGGARRAYRRLVRDRHAFRIGAIWAIECGLLLPDGSIRAHTTRRGPNLVVDMGLDAAKALLFDAASGLVAFGWIAIGSDITPVSAADVALLSELARAAGSYTAGGTGAATLDHTFGAGVGTGSVAEVGAFNDATAGDMLNRKVFDGAVTKAAGDSLKASCIFTVAPA